jgi:WD40 repeat protein
MKSPFKFLDAYQKKDKDIFFGRAKEIELLYDTTFETDLLLVYGPMGTGKTSLIQCGLANRFRESDWFDLYIRRGDNINTSLWEEIYRHTKRPGKITIKTTVPQAVQFLYLDFFKPVYLIFDQFEELFILGTPEEQQTFFNTISDLLNSGISCKIIFAMREEYIAWLYDFEQVVPQLFDHRIRVEPMNMLNVEGVIRGSAHAFAIRLVQPDETVKQIIENNKDKKGTIQLPYLQVYLDRLYREAEAAKLSNHIKFTPGLVEKIGKISDVMAAFLDEQTEQVQRNLNVEYPDAPDEVAWQVLNQFATVEGTNLPLQKEALYSKLQVPEDIINFCLAGLEKARILRLSEKDDTYEIAHDSLARRIDDKRSVEEKTLLKVEKLVKDRFAAYEDTAAFLTKEELNYIEPYEKKLKSKLDSKELNFIAKSRKKASKRRTIIGLGMVVLGLIISLAVFAFWQWREAAGKTIEANANRLAAIAGVVVEEDPTIALRLAEEACRLDKNQAINDTIYKIYRENIFYKIVAKHKESVNSVAFSPDGKTILTGSKDGTAWLWDMEGNLVQEFKGHKREVLSVAFSPDGKTILTGSKDNTARLWDRQGNPMQEFEGHNFFVNCVAFSSNGKNILTGSWDNTARLWDRQGNVVQEFKGHKKEVISVAFSPDGKTILTGSGDKTARLWNLQGNLVREFKDHKGGVLSVAFSPDGKTILTGSGDKTARLWNLQGNPVQEFKGHEDYVTAVVFSPDGKTILTGSEDNTARLWDLWGNQVQEFKGHEGEVLSVAFSPDGKTILTSGDNTARLWDRKGNALQEFKGHTLPVSSVAFSPDGKTIITSGDNTARLWDRKGNALQEFKGHKDAVLSVAFSPDGKTILTGSLDKTARLWNLRGNLLQEFKGHKSIVTSVAFSPDGKNILTGSYGKYSTDTTARLWDLRGNPVQEFKGHKSWVRSMAFSPDGKTILTDSGDKTAQLWDRQGNMLQEFKGHKSIVTSVAFSPDGKNILTGSFDNTARLWDLRGNLVQEFKGHKGHVSSVAFSPDGKTILTGSADKTARLWDRQGNPVQEFKGHKDAVMSVAFSPDGKTILTGSHDRTARLWEIGMKLEEFLKKGNFERLSEKQKKEYGIGD